MTPVLKSIAACVVLTCIAAPAEAQPRRPRAERGFIAVNGGGQNAAGTLRDSFTYEANAETGTIDVEYPGKRAMLFDGAIGVRVWRRLGLAVAVTRSTASGSAPISARVPHPFFDNRHRTVEGQAGGISRAETAAHVQLYYDLPMTGALRVRLGGGPSFFTADQEIVQTVDVNETYPYDTAEFRTAVTKRATGSAPGFNASADLSWMFSRHTGLGALVRYSRGALDLEADGVRTVSSDGGGLQFGGGLRIRF